MKQVRDISAIVLFGTATAVGCGGSTARPSAPATAAGSSTVEEEEAAAGLVEHHRHHHHGGVMLLIAMSLDTLGVSPDQRASVEKIRSDLHTRMEPASAAERKLLSVLADGLAGTLDPDKVDAAVAELASAAATTYEASTDALNQLHAVLTPPQRAAVIDKLEAHWSVWQRANNGDDLTQLTFELGLSPEQVERIRASVAEGMRAVPRFDPQEVTAHIRAFSDAFRAPTFDAKTLTTGPAATAHMVAWGGAHIARVVEAASPVLTPEQRANLAQILREHANHNPSANGA